MDEQSLDAALAMVNMDEAGNSEQCKEQVRGIQAMRGVNGTLEPSHPPHVRGADAPGARLICFCYKSSRTKVSRFGQSRNSVMDVRFPTSHLITAAFEKFSTPAGSCGGFLASGSASARCQEFAASYPRACCM